MKLTTILFDLDGTLLPMDNDAFTRGYFKLLAAKLARISQAHTAKKRPRIFRCSMNSMKMSFRAQKRCAAITKRLRSLSAGSGKRAFGSHWQPTPSFRPSQRRAAFAGQGWSLRILSYILPMRIPASASRTPNTTLTLRNGSASVRRNA